MSRVFIEFSVGDDQHRLDIQLFDNRCPKAVANFLYLLCAHEIPDHIIAAREQHIGGPLPAPLKATRISRLDVARQQIDFGVSGTASVYGGCYDDETVGPTQQEQQDLQSKNPNKKLSQIVHPNFLHDFGTISVANCGPNSNGSKYFISLGRRQDTDGLHQIIGSVASHSQQALRDLATCKVSIKKGCVPEPAIKISDCGIIRALNENGWKDLALGTNSSNNNNNNGNNNNDQLAQQPLSRLKMLKGRGSQLEKRSAQGDGEDLLNFERGNNSSEKTFANLQANLDAGELARRRAKKRRIEDAAAGAGAWVEPPEVVEANQGSANRTGVVENKNDTNNNNFNNSNNNSNGNNNKMSISQAFQAAGGNLDRATQMVMMNDSNNNNGQSERTVFAVAARANQFMQDIDFIAAAQKAKTLKKNNNNKKRTLRY